MRHALAALVLAAACSSTSVAPRDCTPGQTVACDCPGGGSAVQVCGTDGRLGACMCPDAGAAEDQLEVDAAEDVAAADVVAPDASCGTGRVRCGGACVDTLSDGTNCGTCGRVCGTATRCESGTCVAGDAGAGMDAGAPGADVVDAGGMCPEQCTRSNDCDPCRSGAEPGSYCCVSGLCLYQTNRCAPDTDAGADVPTARDACRIICDAGCADPDTDVRNCGRCGNDCTLLPGVDPARVTCERGVCNVRGACLTGRLNCSGNQSTGCESSVTTSFRCGSCSSGCGEPRPVCAPSTDAPTGYACTSDCVAPLNARCGGVCVNTDTDRANCGGCRRACAAGQVCQSGSCR